MTRLINIDSILPLLRSSPLQKKGYNLHFYLEKVFAVNAPPPPHIFEHDLAVSNCKRLSHKDIVVLYLQQKT